MAFILGTAGHIDHGKTTLVRALTSIDCDRLIEEKERGITIDLGFAWLDLDGERLGIVDVPGHERFVKTMVSGASGMDMVMLIIAADEGIMPQTREHLEICTLLGVTQGFVVITKKDLVEEDFLELVEQEVREYVASSFLAEAPIFTVSAKTKEGLPELLSYLKNKVKKLSAQQTSDIFRLPVDRVFTLKGHGTVVTGTVASGFVHTADPLMVYPKGLSTKGRSLERHGETCTNVETGSRLAINLQGLEKQDIERGDVLAHPNTLIPQRRWFLFLTNLAQTNMPIKQRSEVHFHHQTKELQARLVFRDRTILNAGESAFCEALFTEPMCGLFNDRFVIRAGSPLRTIAGGCILSPIPPQLNRKAPTFLETLDAWQHLLSLNNTKTTPKECAYFVQACAELLADTNLTIQKFRLQTGLTTKLLEQSLEILTSQGSLILWDKEERLYCTKADFSNIALRVLEKSEALHKKAPLKTTFAKSALHSTLQDVPEKLLHKVITSLIKQNKLIVEGEGLRSSSHQVHLEAEQKDLKSALLKAHKDAALTPPNYKDVLAALNAQEKEANQVLAILCKEGSLIRIKDGLYYEKSALEQILAGVRSYFETHDNLDIAALKTIFPLSRKYLVALLEYMDNARITMRIGDQRKLRRT
ncbi:MAG: selenocysteine-specific translation elongation factor [Desulfovibrio sp.]|nr:selenocysteine-specific translation elongation factor [Desulfovibrio sp.]